MIHGPYNVKIYCDSLYKQYNSKNVLKFLQQYGHFILPSRNYIETRQAINILINVTLRRFRVATVAVEKQ